MLDENLLRAVDRIHLLAYDECTGIPCQHSSIGESDGRINIPGTMSCPTLHPAAPCPPSESPARAASVFARPFPPLLPPLALAPHALLPCTARQLARHTAAVAQTAWPDSNPNPEPLNPPNPKSQTRDWKP